MNGVAVRRREGALFPSIAGLWAVSLVAAPLLYVVAVSFLSRGRYGGVVSEPTLSNYARLASPEYGPMILSALGRSTALAAANTLLCLAVAFPLVLFLVFGVERRWRNTLLLLLVFPFWTNFLIRTYAWFALLSDGGWVNAALAWLGLPEGNWLFTPRAVLLGMFYNYLPYMAVSLYLSVERLDPLLLDAASDLGGGRLARFVKVVLPLSFPGILAGSVMVFIPSLGEFVIPDVLGGGTKLYVGNLLAQQFLTVRDWPFGSAITVGLLLVFAAGILAVRARRKGGGPWTAEA